MSLVVLPYPLTNGTVADGSQVISNLSAITNVVNGNIDNTNLSTTLTITDNKLAQITSAAKVSGSALTGFSSIPSGAGIIPAANLTYQNIQYPYVNISNTQPQNTGGGTTTSGGWMTTPLNTINVDTQTISSLGSNQVTLPAGNYLVKCVSPIYLEANNSFHGQTRLFNSTASSVLSLGTSIYGNSTGNRATLLSLISGIITLSTSSAIILQYQVDGGLATNGLGFPSNFGTEVYAVVEFTKVG